MAAWKKERETAIPPEPGPLSAEQEARFVEFERRWEEWKNANGEGPRPIEVMGVFFPEFQLFQRWQRYHQWRARQVAGEKE